MFSLLPSAATTDLWFHLLAAVPGENPQGFPAWLKCGAFLRWSDFDDELFQYQVDFILFESPVPFVNRFRTLLESKKWRSLTADPFVLVAWLFQSWHERIDEAAWAVTNKTKDIERV